jgi:Fibronectin type III domain
MFGLLLGFFLQTTITRPTTLSFAQSSTSSVTATWSANPATDDVVVYRLYYGTAPATYTFPTIDIAAPATSVVVSNLVQGTTYYFALQARAAVMVSALSTEVSYTVPQTNLCLDSNGNAAVQLRVLSFTPTLAAGGLGQLLWTITSVNRIVTITATLANSAGVSTAVSTIDGSDSMKLDLSKTAGVNFNAPSTSGSYTLVVSAVDVNGCKADTSGVNRVINVP